jgi:MFS transporter, SP family, sugar:H+ symporter
METMQMQARDQANLGFIARIVAVATIGGFMFGYDSGAINGTQGGIEQAFILGDIGIGAIVASILVGCAVGAFGAGRLADVLGRRRVMMIAAVLFLLSALGAGFAGSAALLMFARFVGGLGVGAASVISPMYISEVAPAHLRGRLSSAQQVMIIAGLTAAFVANYILAGLAGRSTETLWLGFAAWRWMFWMQVVPAAVYFVALFAIPESPRWLVLRGHTDEARGVLVRLFGSAAAEQKVAEIAETLANDHHRPRFADLLDPRSGKLRKIVWAGIGLAVFQQLSGIVAIFYYGAVLWQSVGFGEADALRINILSGTLSIIACFISIAVVDRIGRKPLLVFGSVVMAVALAVLAGAFAMAVPGADGAPQLPATAALTALIAANIFAAVFNGTWGPVMWVMLGEMFPTQLRGSAIAVAGAAQWGANFAVTVSFPSVAHTAGLPLTYGVFALCSLISAVFVWRMVHETSGRELEQMAG